MKTTLEKKDEQKKRKNFVYQVKAIPRTRAQIITSALQYKCHKNL